jgi:hypothetical protein
MTDVATERGWPWQVECVQKPDEVLAATDEIIVTADSVVLDRCQRWFNLTREVICRHVPRANIVPAADYLPDWSRGISASGAKLLLGEHPPAG